jgi:hypothetical protein
MKNMWRQHLRSSMLDPACACPRQFQFVTVTSSPQKPSETTAGNFEEEKQEDTNDEENKDAPIVWRLLLVRELHTLSSLLFLMDMDFFLDSCPNPLS